MTPNKPAPTRNVPLNATDATLAHDAAVAHRDSFQWQARRLAAAGCFILAEIMLDGAEDSIHLIEVIEKVFPDIDWNEEGK